MSVYGYASSIDVLNANWKTRPLTVCILNNAEKQYEDLFIDGVNTWSSSWTYLEYNFGKPLVDDCNITAYIVKAYADLTSKGHAGVTITQYEIGGGIIKSDILIPTEIEREDHSIYRVTSTTFHRIAMHEFGHAIGLRHASDENYVEPVDMMAPILAPDDIQMLISKSDISALNDLYNVETEFIPPVEKKIEPLPPPSPIPQVLEKMEIDIERAVYYSNETLTFTVNPPTTVGGIAATIIFYPPEGKDRIVMHEEADPNGVINVEIPLEGKLLGIWTVKVTYVSWVSQTAFALKAAGSTEPELAYQKEEFSIKIDKSEYELGETVAVYGTAHKRSGWWLEVVEPRGKIFSKIDPASMKLKSDGSFEAFFTLSGDQLKSVGTWTIRILEDLNPGVEKSSVIFDVLPSEFTKVEVRVQAKQIRDLVLVRLRNMGDSNADLYGLIMKSGDDTIKACKGTRQWNVESCEPDRAILFTGDKPVGPGEKSYFRFKVNKEIPVFNWEVYDSGRHILDSGSMRPFIR
ncbi:MAG: matrixin family metalloprotease [Nitrososphaerales archaeon]